MTVDIPGDLQVIRFLLPLFVSFLIGTLPLAVMAQEYRVNSPDEQTTLTVRTGENISWSVTRYGRIVLPEVLVDMKLEGSYLGDNPGVRKESTRTVRDEFEAVLPVKSRKVTNEYAELVLEFRDRYSLEFRVFDTGVAYRFTTRMSGTLEIEEEVLDITFPEGTHSHFPLEESTYSHNERTYIPARVDTITREQFASLPILFTIPGEESDIRLLFSEADVFDYPHLFLQGGAGTSLQAMHPPVVAESRPEEGPGGDRNVVIVREEPFIAHTRGRRSFPWRFFVITKDDRELLSQNLMLQLSRETELRDISWIKPGKVAWDWWNANNLQGVDFEAGLNTKTYKYYIDFAAAHNIEYVILDEGWTKSTLEIMEFNPDIDVKELIDYGRERNVGIILWCLWKPLNENMEEILDIYAGWGAKGIKVDFMQRSDQAMTNSYEAIARECASRKLLVDFHGAFKPAGLRRAYPNVITYEGVKGNEHLKWSHEVTPSHNATLPFIRMAVGPMDFTPGALRNFHLEEHYINFDRPASIGTRAHQVALYTVFESPLQMLCDAPTSYEEEPETTAFIVQIPTTWDEIVPLAAKVGEYVAVARRHGQDWYVGVISNESARTVTLDFSFLPEGEYEAEIFRDGLNADRHAEDYIVEKMSVAPGNTYQARLAGGGGWSAIIRKK